MQVPICDVGAEKCRKKQDAKHTRFAYDDSTHRIQVFTMAC